MMNSEASTSPLLIIGASARSAVFSAVRSRLRPIAIDMFEDEDLKSVCETIRVGDYPFGLPALALKVDSCHWIYTGGLENYPDVVHEISQRHRLFGNGIDVLRRVRDPFWLKEVLGTAGFSTLGLRQYDQPPPNDGTWLLKRYQSANGTGVSVWDEVTSGQIAPNEFTYFQEYKCGRPISALFLATDTAAFLIGVGEQFVAGNDPLLRPFTFCGGVAPIRLQNGIDQSIEQIGHVVATNCGMRGLFGCDFVLSDDAVWLNEVNPRYPATAELYELALEAPLLRWHVMACNSYDISPSSKKISDELEAEILHRRNLPRSRFCAKRIIYAEFGVQLQSTKEFTQSSNPECPPMIADIPRLGSTILPGQPICTVLALEESIEDCFKQLDLREGRLRSSLRYLPTLETSGPEIPSELPPIK